MTKAKYPKNKKCGFAAKKLIKNACSKAWCAANAVFEYNELEQALGRDNVFFDFISKGATDTFAGMKKEALRRKELYNHTKRIAEIQEINDSTNEKLLLALQFWDHPLESNQWGESHEYEKWLNLNVEPTIEKANSKLNPLGKKLTMTPAVAELYEKCQNRLYDLRSKDKEKDAGFRSRLP